ncbi:MAG: ABC transporter substrate-binding protein [Rubrivivax sp.]|nr:ABC transporter substrate-binding protein [Rubrivivax sp.]
MTLRRRSFLVGAPSALSLSAASVAAAPAKVLRVAFNSAETGFDPAKISDLYSRTVTAHLFEALYAYDHLARPFKIKPLTADGMPESSADFREWTIRLRPGIYFADDPAFKGERRELVAADYVYAIKRLMDPANKSPVGSVIQDVGIIGLNELRDGAVRDKRSFNYDVEIDGLRAPDRRTLKIRLEQPRPRLLQLLAASDLLGGVAREVVEFYGNDISAHPVGTGPFRLAQWRRSSLIVLERNPDYRERLYDAEPAPDDAEGQAILAALKGKRIPMVDRVEVNIITEEQPRWLTFLNGGLDMTGVPAVAITQALPNNRLAPHLAKKGIRLSRTLNADGVYTYFNMDDPVVGGYGPAQVALRRAMSLALDVPTLINRLYRGQGIQEQSLFIPHCSGFDPKFKSEMGDHDPARAKALLDMYGFVDRDGDGFRERPDGSPLSIEIATQPSQFSRQFDEVFQKDFAAVGVRVSFFTGQWSEQLKAAYAGKLQMWTLGGSAASPDGVDTLQSYISQQIGSGQNFARFRNDEIDAIYEQVQRIADGPQREALFKRAKVIGTAFMPYKGLLSRISNDLTQKHLVGYRRPLFWNEWWHLADIDPGAR